MEKFDIVEQCTQKCQEVATQVRSKPFQCDVRTLSILEVSTQKSFCLLSDKDREPYEDNMCLFFASTTLLHI